MSLLGMILIGVGILSIISMILIIPAMMLSGRISEEERQRGKEE